MEARLTIPSLGYMEAEPESSVPKRHRSDITVGQKREICLYKLQHPAAKNRGMALHFSQLYGTSIGRSTIGDIIKRAPHWLSQSDHIVNTTRKISPRHFELEKQLYEFTTEAQGRGMKVTDELLLRKAREIGEQVGVPADFKYSRGWLSNCKRRTNKLIYDDTSVENSIMVDVGCAEEVIQQLMGNNSTQDASSGKQKTKTAKRKRPANEVQSEPESVSCAVCNVSLLTTRGHKHLDDVVHDYTRTPNPANALASKTAREIGEQVGVPADFKYSRGWLSNCKRRTNKLIYDDTSVENSIMVDVGCAEEVIQQLMGNNSTQDASSGKQKTKTAKRKRPANEVQSEPESVSCAVCNVSLLTTRGHKHLDDVVHDYTRTPNPANALASKTAREIGEQVGVPADFKYSRGWLSNCKRRTNKLIYDDTSVENSIMVDVGCAEEVIQQLMGNNSTQDASSGKQKTKTAKRKRPANEVQSEPESVSCAVCNVSLLTTRGHKHLDDVVHDYTRTPNPANALASKTVRARLEPLLEEPLDGSTWLCSMCYTTLVQLEEYNNLLALYRERHRSTARLQRQLRQSATNQGANRDINQGTSNHNQENEKDACPSSSKRTKTLTQSTLLQSYMGSLGLAKQRDDSPTVDPNPHASSVPSAASSPPHEINLENVIKNILTQQNVDLSTLTVSTDTLHHTHLEAVIKKMLETQTAALTVSSSCSPTSSSTSATDSAAHKKGTGKTKKGSCRTEASPVINPENVAGIEGETESDDSSSERQPLSPVPHELDGTVDSDSVILGCGLEMDDHEVDGAVDLTCRRQAGHPCIEDSTGTSAGLTLSHDTYSQLQTLLLRPDQISTNTVWRPWRKDVRDAHERGENETVDETAKNETSEKETVGNGAVTNETRMDENEMSEIEMNKNDMNKDEMGKSETGRV